MAKKRTKKVSEAGATTTDDSTNPNPPVARKRGRPRKIREKSDVSDQEDESNKGGITTTELKQQEEEEELKKGDEGGGEEKSSSLKKEEEEEEAKEAPKEIVKKSKGRREGSNDWKDIPDDLLPGILCKLPARSICRFRCVCKSWRDLFGDEEFMNKTRAKPPFEFEVYNDRAVEYINIDETGFMTSKGIFYMEACSCNYRRCNNLICHQSFSGILRVSDMSTEETHLLRLPPFEPYNFEFGFDPRSKQYKILVWKDASSTRPRPRPDFCILYLDLHDVEGGRNHSPWRSLLAMPICSFRSSSFEKSLATTTGMFYLVNAASHRLISCNLSTERLRIIRLPHQVLQRRKMNQSDFWYQLFEYQGCLCWVELSVTGKTFSEMEWEITGMWLLKDHVDDIKWVRLTKEIPLPLPMPLPVEVTSASITWSQKHSQFSSTRSGEIMITIPCTPFDEEPCLLLYNFLDCEFRTIQLSMDWDDHFCGLDNNESCIELL